MNLENEITKLCLDKYDSLKKTGKPSENEWTVLSGVVLLKNRSNELSVISLCTGTKCLSGSELKNATYYDRGDRLSDSHAEILARRAFLRYIYNQIQILYDKKESEIFCFLENNIKLKDVSFHFFSSQTPCGDCSIILKLTRETNESTVKKMKKEDNNQNESEFGAQIIDIYRTGAKCLENDQRQDLHENGASYHTVGPLRTKPGRGDRTLSLSCSDKIAKWHVVGVQGALLSLIVPSIYFDSITIGGGCPYSLEAMQRGIYKRFNSENKSLKINQSKFSFDHRKGDLRTRPCPSSIVWCAVSDKPIEISVEGFKQGATKKRKKSRGLLISRKQFFKTFLKVFEKFFNGKIFLHHPKKVTYYHFKQFSSDYQNLWKKSFKNFSSWPSKPLYLQECLSF